MIQEDKNERKVAIKEKPLGGTEVVEETRTQVMEQTLTADQPARTENVASKGGEVIGAGLKKVGEAIGELADGVSKKIGSGETTTMEEEVQMTEQLRERMERTKEAPEVKVTEKVKIERRVTRETQ